MSPHMALNGSHVLDPRRFRFVIVVSSLGSGALMRRRDFITAFGGAALAPFARAQQPKLPTVGMLGAGTPTSHGKWIDGLVARLHELGWTDGDNVRIAYRWAQGSDERTAEIATDFVRQNVDVIVTSGNQAVKTVMRTTAQVPIIAAAM